MNNLNTLKLKYQVKTHHASISPFNQITFRTNEGPSFSKTLVLAKDANRVSAYSSLFKTDISKQYILTMRVLPIFGSFEQ